MSSPSRTLGLLPRTLCFDTSAREFTAALLEGETIVAQSSAAQGVNEKNGSKSLAPSIQRMLAQAGWRMQQLQRIVLTIGPGSFSGLRLGVVTAKVLGYSLGLPIFGLNTLAVLAFKAATQAREQPVHEIVALLDAQRGELFAQRFKLDSGGLPAAAEARQIISCSELEQRYPTEILTGSGLQLITRAARRAPPDDFSISRLESLRQRLSEESLWRSDAVSVGRLAERMGVRLGPLDHWNILPDYGRPSAAEEKEIERELEPRRKPQH